MPDRFIISGEPLVISPEVNYENQRVKCARCSAIMEAAPWPTNSVKISHRPRCGECGSSFTYTLGPMTEENRQILAQLNP